MPMMSIFEAVIRQEMKGKKVCLKCDFPEEGVTWLGFGQNKVEAMQDLQRAITNYFKAYESR